MLCDSIDPELEMAYADEFSREFGFTLIGVKPASIEEFNSDYFYLHPTVISDFLKSLTKTFSQSKKFVFKTFNQNSSFFTAELIHKPSLRKLISENQALRDFIKINFEDESDFHKKLHDPNVKIFDLLNRDPFIIGIVLGYGEANSEYYCRRIQVGKYLQKYHIGFSFLPYTGPCFLWSPGSFDRNMRLPYILEKPKPSLSFNSLEDEWKWIEGAWWDLSEERTVKPPYSIALPCYVCRHGGDSEMIRNKYQVARVTLANLLSTKSLLKAASEQAIK